MLSDKRSIVMFEYKMWTVDLSLFSSRTHWNLLLLFLSFPIKTSPRERVAGFQLLLSEMKFIYNTHRHWEQTD